MDKELFIRRKMAELEEWGEAHDPDCGVNREDECDCAFFADMRTALGEAWVEAIAQQMTPTMPKPGTQARKRQKHSSFYEHQIE